MIRTYKYKAWIESPEEKEIIEAAQRVYYEFERAAQLEELPDARNQLYESLADLWTPNRQDPARWLQTEHRRMILRRKKGKPLKSLEERKESSDKGVLFGVFHTKAEQKSWDNVLKHTRKKEATVLVTTHLVDEKNGKPVYEVKMPVWMDRKKDPLRFRFIMHRPPPENGKVYRFFLVVWPKICAGKRVGCRWEMAMRVEIPDPEQRHPRRVGTWQPRWHLNPDGSLLVGELEIDYLDRTTKRIRYELPAGVISRARKAHHLSITGENTEMYHHFVNWRKDKYFKIARDITHRVDMIKILNANTNLATRDDQARYRAFVSSGQLSAIIEATCKREGLLITR
ncbi:hypothetical protein B1757_02370 [Acidithiobacillus marinus]|uniref:Uncharacterized protein n=1 Tax=Acidithiobacillus marinus TaxID=187490 RepID=A0A2I1DPN0_9PROT|nr:hypothetical protein [Acidithiobacillus marinus]PKY11826.1 hypothetical protein B1757_02370 [Acidithiobacillus marinus]